MAGVVVTHHPEQSRYEAHVDGALAGFAAYRILRGHQVFTHTEVDEAFEGQGVGGALARGALDDVRAMGEHDVVAMCPFMAAWIDRTPTTRTSSPPRVSAGTAPSPGAFGDRGSIPRAMRPQPRTDSTSLGRAVATRMPKAAIVRA